MPWAFNTNNSPLQTFVLCTTLFLFLLPKQGIIFLCLLYLLSLPGWGALPYYLAHTGMCRWTGYCFQGLELRLWGFIKIRVYSFTIKRGWTGWVSFSTECLSHVGTPLMKITEFTTEYSFNTELFTTTTETLLPLFYKWSLIFGRFNDLTLI